MFLCCHLLVHWFITTKSRQVVLRGLNNNKQINIIKYKMNTVAILQHVFFICMPSFVYVLSHAGLYISYRYSYSTVEIEDSWASRSFMSTITMSFLVQSVTILRSKIKRQLLDTRNIIFRRICRRIGCLKRSGQYSLEWTKRINSLTHSLEACRFSPPTVKLWSGNQIWRQELTFELPNIFKLNAPSVQSESRIPRSCVYCVVIAELVRTFILK